MNPTSSSWVEPSRAWSEKSCAVSMSKLWTHSHRRHGSRAHDTALHICHVMWPGDVTTQSTTNWVYSILDNVDFTCLQYCQVYIVYLSIQIHAAQHNLVHWLQCLILFENILYVRHFLWTNECLSFTQAQLYINRWMDKYYHLDGVPFHTTHCPLLSACSRF